MLLRIALRNSLRNQRRTILTASSIFFAVFISIAMRSMQTGSYRYIYDMAIYTTLGQVQIHDSGYWDEKTLEYSFSYTPELISRVKEVQGTHHLFPRVESFSLAAFEQATKPVMLIGMDFNKEKDFSNPAHYLQQGSLPHSNTDEVLIGTRLAQKLGVSLGDTLALLGQGLYGMSAHGLFVVSGIAKFTQPEMNKSVISMPISASQRFLSLGNNITSLCITGSDKGDDFLLSYTSLLKNEIKNGHEVMTWKELYPELIQQIEADNVSGMIFLIIIYVVVAFGIFGTIIMILSERKREYSILLSLGFKQTKLVILNILELFYVSFLGLTAGIIVSVPLVYYYYLHPIYLTGDMAKSLEEYGYEPIMPFAFNFSLFANQTAAVIIMIVVVAFFPILKLFTMKPLDGLHR